MLGRPTSPVLRVLLATLVAALACGRSAAAADTPSYLLPIPATAVEEGLWRDAADGRLDDHRLLDAALIAAGRTAPAEVTRYRQQVDAWARLLAAGAADGRPVDRERVFRFLHARVFTGRYEPGLCDAAATIDSGDYNCLTATLLFVSLCRQLELPIDAAARPGHVLALAPAPAALVGAPPTPIELTAPHWFDGGSASTGAAGVESLATLRSLSDIELLAKVLYNRALLDLADRRFADAGRWLVLSRRWDAADRAAEENLWAVLNNWALDRCQAGDYEQAWRLLADGQRLAPDYPPLRANELHVAQRWAQSLCERGDFAAAAERLDAVLARRGPEPTLVEARRAVDRAWRAAGSSAALHKAQ